MTTAYISTTELAGRLISYPEKLPVAVSPTLQQNLRQALAVSGLVIGFFAFGPRLLGAVAWSNFFVPWDLVDWPAHLALLIANATMTVSPIMLALNITGLAVIGLLYWRSKGLSRPVEEVFHWLAASAVLVAAVSALIGAVIVVGTLTTIAIALALWILIGVLILLAIIFCFGVLGLAAGAS